MTHKVIVLGRNWKDNEDNAVQVVDGIDAPVIVLDEAQELANKTRKIHFIGVLDERNPEWKETPETRYTFQKDRLRETGEFVLADDHDHVASYKGNAGEFIGAIIWVVPKQMVNETYPKQQSAKSNYVVPFEGSRDPGTLEGSGDPSESDPIVDHIDCSGCHRPIPIYANARDGRYTDRSTAKISRGSFAVPNEEGDMEGHSEENIKAEFFVCSRCYLTDPDLCAFFNKAGLRTR